MTQEQSTRSARRVHTPMPTKSQEQRAARRRWVVALLLVLAGLAAPFSAAQAQTEIWSATLTAGTYTFNNQTFYGWNIPGNYTGGSLTDTGFSYGGQFSGFSQVSIRAHDGSLYVAFSTLGDLAMPTIRDKLTFHAGGMAFKLSEGTYDDGDRSITWASPVLTWAANDMVALKMTTTDPGAPALTATPGPEKVTLNWTPPASTGGSAITGYEYRQRTGADYADDAWTAIPNSASLTSYDVPSLTVGTAYTFQLRASNASGAGLYSEEVTATPTAVDWSVTADPSTIVEDGGVSTVTVSTGGATFTDAKRITLEFSGTAVTSVGDDFELHDADGNPKSTNNPTFTLAAGETEVTATVTAQADMVEDPDETIVIQAKVGEGTALDQKVDIGDPVTITISEAPSGAPMVSSVAITSDPNQDTRPGDDGTYAIGDFIAVEVTFSAAVTVNTDNGTPRIKLHIGDKDEWAAYTSPAPDNGLTFSYFVGEGDEDTDGIEVMAGNIDLNGGTIKEGDGTGPDAVLTHDGAAADANRKVDGIRPMLVEDGAEIAADAPDKILLKFKEDLGHEGAKEAFTVTVAGAGRTVTATATTTDTTIQLTLASAVAEDETVTVTYTVPTNDADAVQDSVGNGAAGFTNEMVTNNIGAPPSVCPRLDNELWSGVMTAGSSGAGPFSAGHEQGTFSGAVYPSASDRKFDYPSEDGATAPDTEWTVEAVFVGGGKLVLLLEDDFFDADLVVGTEAIRDKLYLHLTDSMGVTRSFNLGEGSRPGNLLARRAWIGA